jgi:hypothetical protein
MNSWAPAVKRIDEETWTVNGLRFATADEALAYCADLQSRWPGCRPGPDNRRAEPSNDPVTHAWIGDGPLHQIKDPDL